MPEPAVTRFDVFGPGGRVDADVMGVPVHQDRLGAPALSYSNRPA